jgi:hypothetical protein
MCRELLTRLLGAVLAAGPAAGAPASVARAELLPGGRAVAPDSTPPAVKAMIEAGNRIRHRPYRWGGGHRREHVFAVIAGLRWDTSFSTDGDRTGPGWSEYMRPRARGSASATGSACCARCRWPTAERFARSASLGRPGRGSFRSPGVHKEPRDARSIRIAIPWFLLASLGP